MAKSPVMAPCLLLLLAIAAPLCMAANILHSDLDGSMKAGQALSWGPYFFVMQGDCNLVLYDAGKAIWATNTGGLASDCRLTMQSDGNLVVYGILDSYSNEHRPVWDSGFNGPNGHYVVVMQKDRNVVVYGQNRWSTRTNIPLGIPGNATRLPLVAPARPGAARPTGAPTNILQSGESLKSDEGLYWGPYAFIMQGDCNLVLYDAGVPIFHSNTASHSRPCRCSLERNGDLVVYNRDNVRLWSSNTGGEEGHYVLVMQRDRNVVIYGVDRFATGTHTGVLGIAGALQKNGTGLVASA